ncbi:hypothetical protein KCU92_g90, partial [Aureobasidium melanogenum]
MLPLLNIISLVCTCNMVVSIYKIQDGLVKPTAQTNCTHDLIYLTESTILRVNIRNIVSLVIIQRCIRMLVDALPALLYVRYTKESQSFRSFDTTYKWEE